MINFDICEFNYFIVFDRVIVCGILVNRDEFEVGEVGNNSEGCVFCWVLRVEVDVYLCFRSIVICIYEWD